MQTECDGRSSVGSTLLGGPTTIQLERRVEIDFPAERFDQVVELIIRRTHRRGRRAMEEGSLVWENSSDVESMGVTVIPGAGETRIRLFARYGGMTAFIFFATFFTVLFLTAAFGGFVLSIRSVAAGLKLLPVGLILSYLASRAFWRAFARRRAEALNGLMEALTQLVAGENVEGEDGDGYPA
jgi:hypothetical protein